MTGRATFGDFLQAARRHLDPPPGTIGQPPARGDVEEVSQSLMRVLTVMGRYLRDLTTAFDGLPTRIQPTRSSWARACIEAREAVANSAVFLARYRPATSWPAAPAASPLARRLDGVATSLATGRDLLQTHFAPGARGSRQHRSEWAVVVSSPQVTRALLAELASLGRQIARQGTDLALAGSPDARATEEVRRRLNAACQWLWAMDASVRAAHQREPVSERDRELLWAIPANARPPRRFPDHGDPAATLREGVIASAERVRHAAWLSAAEESWFPGLTITSLRGVAEAATVTSHHCDVLLRSLAGRTGWPGRAASARTLWAVPTRPGAHPRDGAAPPGAGRRERRARAARPGRGTGPQGP